MNYKVINLVSLKPPGLEGRDFFFDDSVRSVKYVLESIGCHVIVSANKIVVDAVNVIFGAGTHMFPDIGALKSVMRPDNSVIFNMEQIGSGSEIISEAYLDLLGDYLALDYNFANTLALKNKRPNAESFEFPMPPVPCFAGGGVAPAVDFADVVFYGALSSRRIDMLQQLRERGLKVEVIVGFGDDLTKRLIRSKSIINIHHYPTAIFEIARVLRPVSLGVPVFSEVSVMPKTGQWERAGIRFCDADDFPEVIPEVLRSVSVTQELSRRSVWLTTSKPWVESASRVFNDLIAELKHR